MSSSARCWPVFCGTGHLRVPPLDQLLDARHVDRSVVQVVLDLGEVGGEEATVGADRVAAQRDGLRLGGVLADERQRRRAGVGERDRRRPDRFEQPGPGVHLDDERIHPGQHLVGLVDDEVGALGEHVQLVVGDDGGDLDDHIGGVVEPGHLQIHPHEHCTRLYRWHDGCHGRSPATLGRLLAARSLALARSHRRAWCTRFGFMALRTAAAPSPASSSTASCAAGSGSWLPRRGARAADRPHRPGRRRRLRRVAVRHRAPAARAGALPVDRRPPRPVAASCTSSSTTSRSSSRSTASGARACSRRCCSAGATASSPRCSTAELAPALPGYEIVTDLELIPRELRGLHPGNPVNVPDARRRADRAAAAGARAHPALGRLGRRGLRAARPRPSSRRWPAWPGPGIADA